MNFPAWIGLLRSVVIYYALPWRRVALRRLYRELLPHNALVFDVGAHVGSRSLTILSLGGRSVAIEPQPLFVRWLTWLFRNNTRFTLVAAALGRDKGTLTLRISSRHPTVSTLSTSWIDQVESTQGFTHVAWDKQLDVPVTTVDQLIKEYGRPDFLKIDVEGFELEILQGCSEQIPLVAVEYIPAALDLLWQCIDRLESLGASEFNFVSGESHRFALDHWVSTEQIRLFIEKAASSGGSGDLYARPRSSSMVDQSIRENTAS